jgi:hypothetical protein
MASDPPIVGIGVFLQNLRGRAACVKLVGIPACRGWVQIPTASRASGQENSLDDLIFEEFRPLHGSAPLGKDNRSCHRTLVTADVVFGEGRQSPYWTSFATMGRMELPADPPGNGVLVQLQVWNHDDVRSIDPSSEEDDRDVRSSGRRKSH